MFEPTQEQLAIVQAATESTDNLLVTAYAGAAKTSTLILLSEALADTTILALAFNKKIATEMSERFGPNVKAMTLNGLGHRTWMDATGRRPQIEKDKTYNNMSELIKTLSGEDKDYAYKEMSELMKLVGFAKQCGYIPTGKFERGKRLMDDEDFFEHIEQKLPDIGRWLISESICLSIAQGMKGVIDFDDQIYLPTLFHGAFPRYPLVLVDEAQDLSALNHATLRKLCKKRLIAVGDSRQAIYGFRGAHEDSMNKLRDEFSMREMELTVSFRCPQAVVHHARWRAPTMRYPEWAKPGAVHHLAHWSEADVPQDAFILCRNNAPLFRCAIRLLTAGRHVEVGGTDVVKMIVKLMTKFGERSMIRPDLLDRIDAWEATEKEKTRAHGHGTIEDKAECMRVFANAGETLEDALAFAHHIMSASGPLKLLTGHRAKGLETSHVFILDQQLISKDDQDPNLRYVMQTRAKETLTYITTEGYTD